MVKSSAIVLLSLALAGCAMAPQARLASDAPIPPKRYAWDGAGGQDPNQPQRTVARSIAAHDGGDLNGDLDPDAQLSQSLVICKGCLRSQPTEDARLAKASD